MCGPEDYLFTPLPYFARIPFQAKELKNQFTRPPFEKNLNILASTASIFPQISLLSSSKIWTFQFTSPLFQRQKSVRKPLTLQIRATHPYLKKVECLPWASPPIVMTCYQTTTLLHWIFHMKVYHSPYISD